MKYVEETFYLRPEHAREARQLPAEVYNLAHRLRRHATECCLFVPIRSMQFLAALSGDEVVFVDSEARRFVEIIWSGFKPAVRSSLDEPVAYQAVYFSPQAPSLMGQLQGEFAKALRSMADKQKTPAGIGRVIVLHDASRPA